MKNVYKAWGALFFAATCPAMGNNPLQSLNHQRIFSVNNGEFAQDYPHLWQIVKHVQSGRPPKSPPFILEEDIEAFQEEVQAFSKSSLLKLEKARQDLRWSEVREKSKTVLRDTVAVAGGVAAVGLSSYLLGFMDTVSATSALSPALSSVGEAVCPVPATLYERFAEGMHHVFFGGAETGQWIDGVFYAYGKSPLVEDVAHVLVPVVSGTAVAPADLMCPVPSSSYATTALALGGSVLGTPLALCAGGAWIAYRTLSCLKSVVTAYRGGRVHETIDDLEEEFAKNWIWMPQSLASLVCEKLSLIRQNPSTELAETATDFVSYALGFTVHRPKLPVQNDVVRIMEYVNARIDDFFKDYALDDSAFLCDLKAHVHSFVRRLVTQESNPSACLYFLDEDLEGAQDFTYMLGDVLNECMPESVRLEEPCIETLEDLVGTEERPSLLSTVLRNQEECAGSIVFCRDASWLNAPEASVTECARGLATVPTEYFGKAHKEGLLLQMPIHLMVCSGKDPIEDKRLSAHFDTLVFPKKRKVAQSQQDRGEEVDQSL